MGLPKWIIMAQQLASEVDNFLLVVREVSPSSAVYIEALVDLQAALDEFNDAEY